MHGREMEPWLWRFCWLWRCVVVGLSKGNRGSFDGRDMKERKG